jgi:Leucine-rich repeat (LRR) protein
LESLTDLNIGGNPIREIPPEIGNLKFLRRLLAHECHIKNISKNIGKLTNLHSLILDENQLESVPQEIGNLKRLSNLYLRDNYLTSLPKSIGSLSLVTLDLSENLVTYPPLRIVKKGTQAILEFLRQELKTV